MTSAEGWVVQLEFEFGLEFEFVVLSAEGWVVQFEFEFEFVVLSATATATPPSA